MLVLKKLIMLSVEQICSLKQLLFVSQRSQTLNELDTLILAEVNTQLQLKRVHYIRW